MNRRAALSGLVLLLVPAAAAAQEPRRRGGGETFVPVAPLVTNVLGRGRLRGILTVDVGLEVPDAELRARAESLAPRMRAELFAATQSYGSSLRPGQPPDPDLLGRHLQRVVDRTLGAPGARVMLGTMLVN